MPTDDARAQLAEVDAAIAVHHGHAALHHHRALLLAELGHVEAARDGFLKALSIEPNHFGALNDLGNLLYRADFRTAARTAYAEAVRCHPDNPIGHINLANTLLAAGEIDAARSGFEVALRLDPRHPDALQGLANLLQHQGETEAAERLRQQSYAGRSILHAPFQGTGAPCRVLELVSAVGGAIPTRFMLDPRLFDVQTLAVEAFGPEQPLPPHDVVLNAIGDVDLAPAAPAAAERVLAKTSAPVVNPPRRVAETDRERIARRLSGLPGVIAPRIRRSSRVALAANADAFGFPLLMRSPGYHTGQNFVRVEHRQDLPAAAAALPGDSLLLIEPLDARDTAGAWRKYRVMLVGGARFSLHLAVSDDWKVHYFTSVMAARADHRAEEAGFLADMESVLGPVASAALAHIQDALGLDYAGVDFGLDHEGRLLLFEANAAMVVAPPGPESMWDYRRMATTRIIEAFQGLLLRRSRNGLKARPSASVYRCNTVKKFG